MWTRKITWGSGCWIHKQYVPETLVACWQCDSSWGWSNARQLPKCMYIPWSLLSGVKQCKTVARVHVCLLIFAQGYLAVNTSSSYAKGLWSCGALHPLAPWWKPSLGKDFSMVVQHGERAPMLIVTGTDLCTGSWALSWGNMSLLFVVLLM